MTENEPPIVPPVLYLPVQKDAQDYPVAVIRPMADGKVALIAYTALDRLADACGPNQAWRLVHLSELQDIKDQQHFDVVAFDPPIPASALEGGRIK